MVAIALQGLVAMVITWSGSYEQILSYVVAVDWIFFGFAATALFKAAADSLLPPPVWACE